MALCLIKNPEQLKKVPAGEFGKIMGDDTFFYIDGHVRVYSGEQATFPKNFGINKGKNRLFLLKFYNNYGKYAIFLLFLQLFCTFIQYFFRPLRAILQ
jgi:hypothetical protein